MELDIALDNKKIITDPFDAAVQELDLLLSTEQTQLLGDTNYGVNMEQFLWDLVPSTEDVRKYLVDKINNHTFFCRMLNVDVDVDTVEGTLRDIYRVKITLSSQDQDIQTSKIYTFT